MFKIGLLILILFLVDMCFSHSGICFNVNNLGGYSFSNDNYLLAGSTDFLDHGTETGMLFEF